MKSEPSKLARLVIAYQEKFGRHVPEPALRRVDAGVLAAKLEDSLASGVPISELELVCSLPVEFRLGGCILRDETLERSTPKKGPHGEWLQ